jgi:hypothetical protein
MTSTLVIFTTIRHELALMDPLRPRLAVNSKSSTSSCLNGTYFSIIFGILLLILVICRSYFNWYLLSFSTTGCTFNSFNIHSFIPFVVKKGVAGCPSENFHVDVNRYIPFC